MAKKKVILSFPPRLIQEPVTNVLIRQFDLQITILRAQVRPRERGRMVVEMIGEKQNFDAAFKYLDDKGVQVDPVVQEMRYMPEKCVHCTACVAVCPTHALSVDPQTRELCFEPSKCIICESCIPACSYQAIESQF
ncbi:NIL domain-containing protein [Desulfarculus baarsii]